MAYDYSSENKRLELPNPYRLENFFLFACATTLVLAGLLALIWVRATLQTYGIARGLVPLLVAMGLVASGLGFAATGARRLRFFFGRGRPSSLAPEVGLGTNGGSQTAETFKSQLRQGGLEYPEPQGALNGVLYHLVPQLITAPVFVQHLAQKHFYNALSFFVTALSFLCAWAFFGTPQTRPLISTVYFFFGAMMLFKPLVSGHKARVSTGSLVMLAVIGVVGPVLATAIAGQVPALEWSVHGQTFFMLTAALVAIGLILCAVLAQMDSPPSTERSCEQLTLSFNGPPNALLTELDRRLQDQWTEQIPNRRYSRREPEVKSASGSGKFAGELFEETQPMPMASTQASTLSGALRTARHRWLVLIDLYSTLLAIGGAVFALIYVHVLLDESVSVRGSAPHSWLGYSLICMVIAMFCFRSASSIWGRFNFESSLIWVEMNGEWQVSRIGTGNQFKSKMQTQSDVVRVESMTLRVWSARIESIVFGKDGTRQITAMFSTSQQAREIAQTLAEFANQQSVLIAPKAQADGERLKALQQTEQRLSSVAPKANHALNAPETSEPSTPPPAVPSPQPKAGLNNFCIQCGHRLEASAKFCSECGTAR